MMKYKIMRLAMSGLLIVSMLCGAFSGVKATGYFVEKVYYERVKNIGKNSTFAESSDFNNSVDGYLQLLKLYMKVQEKSRQKGDHIWELYDTPMLQDSSGESYTIRQVSEMGNSSFDYDTYIQKYLNDFETNNETQYSLYKLVESLLYFENSYYVDPESGEVYSSAGQEQMTKADRKKWDVLVSDLEKMGKAAGGSLEDALYQGEEVSLPGNSDNSQKVSVDGVSINITLQNTCQRWLFQDNPAYAEAYVYKLLGDAYENKFKDMSDKGGLDYSRYKKAFQKLYRKEHFINWMYELYKMGEDGDDFIAVMDQRNEEEIIWDSESAVFVNNGKGYLVEELWKGIENREDWYEETGHDVYDTRMYDISASEFARDLKKSYEDKVSKLTDLEKEVGEAFSADNEETGGNTAPCPLNMAADQARCLISLYQQIKAYFDSSRFVYYLEVDDKTYSGGKLTFKSNEISDLKMGKGTKDTEKEEPTLYYASYNRSGELFQSNFKLHGFGMSGDLESYMSSLCQSRTGQTGFCMVGIRLDTKKINSAYSSDVITNQYKKYLTDCEAYDQAEKNLKKTLSSLGTSAVFILLAFLILLSMTGKKAVGEKVCLLSVDRIPIEIMLGVVCCLGVGFLMCGYALYEADCSKYTWGSFTSYYVSYEEMMEVLPKNFFPVILAGIALVICLCLLSLYRRFAARKVLATSLLWRGAGWLKRQLQKIVKKVVDKTKKAKATVGVYVHELPAVKRYLVLMGIYVAAVILELPLCYLSWYDDDFLLLVFLVGVLIFAISFAILIRSMKSDIANAKIGQGAKRIAEGDLSYQIEPMEKLSKEQEELVQTINHIGEGLENAVDESLRSERMKAELITNVSHDIKTPLTSVINYVDLLKRENIDNEKAMEYIEVLDGKSQRLKVLIEDLVEASKASTGNVELQITSLNFNELIGQTRGEFQEKIEAAGLTLVEELPEEAYIFRGDGRRVYRVLENLYGNVVKYAMAGTRVYTSLSTKTDSETGKQWVVFVMKNISREPLNIKPEELTERFVRGEKSRTTEGSGLGLSIAKNLTELMDGRFEIYLDGDLFRVTVEFPM